MCDCAANWSQHFLGLERVALRSNQRKLHMASGVHASHSAFYGGTHALATFHKVIASYATSCVQFLMDRFDESVGLFNAPGPLWIDTFIRANYTSDTNAAMIMLCELMADAEGFLGNASGGV
jgi:hypothetical protein